MTLLVLIWLFCAVICAIIARAKGRSGFAWLLLGAIFGVFALIAILALPGVPDSDYVEPRGFMSSSRRVKRTRCPECRELVISTARVCKHCGYRLDGVGLSRTA